CRHPLEGWTKISVPMNVGLYRRDQLMLSSILPRFRRKQYRLVPDEVVLRREWSEVLAPEGGLTLDRPPPPCPDRKRGHAPFRDIQQFNNGAVIIAAGNSRSSLGLLLFFCFDPSILHWVDDALVVP